ncbi:hypothetical protein AAG570_010018 [Ranatra chinensis]|uniref:Integrase catalytic domain-containing protein n=1 Tax=Ranatra chinensis TaxID=642074 RepID=A0ABD0YLD0_9HEMI
MPRTVAKVIAQCKACAVAKYERRPEQAPQMLTPTPEKPLDVVEVDVMFWAGQKVLTVIDRLTQFAFGHILTDKTAGRVRDGLLTYLGTVWTPGMVVVDKGREFDNTWVRALLEEHNIKVHFTTPGHPRSHGTIERLQSTLADQLRLLRQDKGVEGDCPSCVGVQ